MNSVVGSGGIRASSDSLLRAASAVSRSVRILEDALDAPLFERKERGMLLTPVGALVHARFLRIEAELNAVLDEARDTSHEQDMANSAIEALFDERRLQAAALLSEVHHMPTVGRRMGLSQPAVSGAISRLEGALRHKLFMRTARGMMPTDLGVRWIRRFDRVLAELRYIEDDVGAASGRMQGVVTVGALPLARTTMLPLAISALQAEHPELRVHALESPYEQLCPGLLSGKIDFIVGALRPTLDKAFSSEVLLDDELGLMAASDHPLANKRKLTFAEVCRYPWVLSRPGTPLRDQLSALFAAHGETVPQPVVETGDQTLVRSLLLQGRMLTVLSTRQLRYEIDAGHLKVLRLPMDGLQRRIGITTRTGARLSAAAQALIEQIRRFSQ